MTQRNGSVFGGNQLRVLREKRNLSQQALELEEVITQRNYSFIERGISAPSKDKLEDILTVLRASFNESQEIFKSFGFSTPYPLPSEKETEAVQKHCQPILDALPLPAYLVDIITKLVAWNPWFAKLATQGNDTLMQLKGIPLFKAQFSSRVRLQRFMGELDEVLLADVRMIRERLAPYQNEYWYHAFLEDLHKEPDFQHYWDKATSLRSPDLAPVAFATRILHPVRFKLPDADTMVLTFYSNPEPLQDDSRFQMIYLVPADSFTLRQVERWQNEDALVT